MEAISRKATDREEHCQEEAMLDRMRERRNPHLRVQRQCVILGIAYHGYICANCGAKVACQDDEPPERCPLCGARN